MDIVPTIILFLIGVDIMTKYKKYVDTVRYKLCFSYLELEVSIVRKNGHIYIPWNSEHRIMLRKTELIRPQRGFSHPNNEGLLNLLELGKPQKKTVRLPISSEKLAFIVKFVKDVVRHQ